MKDTQSMWTSGLVLRPSEEGDLPQFYQWERLPEVHRFFSISAGQTPTDVEEAFRAGEADEGTAQYTILRRSDGRPIGRVVLAGRIPGWKAEIFRIYLGELDQRGRGYGRQAMQAVLRRCFRDWAMERVYLDHYTGNPAARLYLSLGFQYEGVLRKNCRKDGVLHDVHLMSMLREEYLRASAGWTEE